MAERADLASATGRVYLFPLLRGFTMLASGGWGDSESRNRISKMVLSIVKIGPLAEDRTTRYPLNYLPSQLPPSPTAHEYRTFP